MSSGREGSGKSEEEEDDGFIIEEAMDEEVYKARKRRRAVIKFDTEEESYSKGLVPKKSCTSKDGNETVRFRQRFVVSEDEGSDEAIPIPVYPNEPEEEEEIEEGGSGLEGSGTDIDSVDDESLSSTMSKGDIKKNAVGVAGKRNLAVKTSQLHKSHLSSNLHKLIYSDTPLPGTNTDSEKEHLDLGGLFQLTKKKVHSIFHEEDSSLSLISVVKDWNATPIIAAAKCLFVTGNWGAESAQTLLEEDNALYGDFEDLETGEGEEMTTEEVEDKGEIQETTTGEVEDEGKEKKRLEKKKKLKAMFDVRYDEEDSGSGTYLDDLKREVSEQEQRNKAEFEGMDENVRLQLEGMLPGHYVRMELKGMYLWWSNTTSKPVIKPMTRTRALYELCYQGEGCLGL